MGDTRQQNGEVQHVSIEIAQLNNKGLADFIKKTLERSNPSHSGSQFSIYRVHEKVRKINEYAYTPEMISIGPFHRGEGSLQAMEEHKLRYVHKLLSPTSTMGPKLEQCVESIKNIEEEARRCYSEPIKINSNDFVYMMVVDGLFIIELLRKTKSYRKVNNFNDDPIFSDTWGLSSLVRDLLLLENQIPMLVLKCLFDLPALKEELRGITSLNMLALRFFNCMMTRERELTLGNCEGQHLLDLLGKTFHKNLHHERTKSKRNSWKFVHSATELQRAGVVFKKGSASSSFLDIKFSDGVLEIPPILIHGQTDSLLRNLIASEQCFGGHVTYMTSYAFFMDRLINNAGDVAFLRAKGIITNYLGDNEAVSVLFNKLCCQVSLPNFYYAELFDQVNKHYKKRWPRWRAILMRDYFNNPWAIVSVIAAVILLLTLAQTIFSSPSFS